MSTIRETIEVGVPVRTAYDQWTQFETFPRFMEGVERITQVTDTRSHWETNIAGVHREFDAEITRQEPDRVIAWTSLEQPRQAGTVWFEPVDGDRTKIELEMEFEPEGAAENVGDKLGIVKRRVKGDLERFREFIEARGHETGAWRGEVR